MLGISDKVVTKLAYNPDGVFLWHNPLNRWPAVDYRDFSD